MRCAEQVNSREMFLLFLQILLYLASSIQHIQCKGQWMKIKHDSVGVEALSSLMVYMFTRLSPQQLLHLKPPTRPFLVLSTPFITSASSLSK